MITNIDLTFEQRTLHQKDRHVFKKKNKTKRNRMYKHIRFSFYLPGHAQSSIHFSLMPPKNCSQKQGFYITSVTFVFLEFYQKRSGPGLRSNNLTFDMCHYNCVLRRHPAWLSKVVDLQYCLVIYEQIY